jgi:phosphate:Na+ symporter
MMLILAELLGGLGLLFIGLRLVSQHLQQTTGKRVRRILQSATRSVGLGLLAGTGAGVVTQSSNAVTLIAGNLVRSGTLGVRDTLPIVAGANIGTAALVFLASANFHLVVLYLVALVGVCYQLRFDRHPDRRDWTGAALGLALLFLGLDFIKGASGQLDSGALASLLAGGLHPAVALIIGIAVATVTQSASSAAILAIAAIHSGVIDLDSGFWLVLGANMGSGIAVLIAGSGLTGSGRQLCLGQVLIKLAGSGTVALAWILAGYLSGTAPGLWLSACLDGRLALGLSVLFLILQLCGGLLCIMLLPWLVTLLVRLSPPSIEERESRPRYIHDLAVEDPVNAIGLAVLERNRLIGLLPRLLPDMDAEAEAPALLGARYDGNAIIVRQTESFMVELIDRHLLREDLDAALQVQGTLGLVRSLQDSLYAFSQAVEGIPRLQLVFTLSESLRTLTLLMADAIAPDQADPNDFAILVQLTGDRGELLDRLRRDLAASLYDAERIRQLLVAAGLFERCVWLLGRLAASLAPAGD